MNSVLSTARGAFFGAVIGLSFAFITSASVQETLATDTNVYASPGVLSPSCENWRDDTNDMYPGVPFNTYWSGKPAYWNDSTVHACWHNDEVWGSNYTWWRAVDYGKPEDTPVYFKATVLTANEVGSQWFAYTTDGCNGINATVYNVDGQYAGLMHYWHVWIGAYVDGTGNVTTSYYSNRTESIRQLGGVADVGADGCMSTGEHLHQAVYDAYGAGGAVAYRHGNPNLYPFYFR